MKDQALWQSLKAGNRQALEQIYSRHAAALLKYGYKFSSNTQLVEDCVQDLFLELWRNREGLANTDSIAKYLFVALRRKVIRQVQRIQKQQSVEEPKEYQFEVALSIDEEIISQESDQALHHALKLALENLSSRQKEIIYLKYFNGMDNKSISEILDINYQSVRNLVSRTLKVLKERLGAWWWLIFCLNLLDAQFFEKF